MRLRPPAFACAALVLAACGKEVVDTADAEQRIRDSVAQQVKADVESVRCPDDVKAKRGGVFTCTVTGADGTQAPVGVRQEDDKGNVSFQAPLLHTGTAESVIEQGVSDRDKIDLDAVDCPDIVVAKAGAKMTCKGLRDRKVYDIAVTQVNDQGDIRYRLGR
jgi:uncharacterized protein DUF4333